MGAGRAYGALGSHRTCRAGGAHQCGADLGCAVGENDAARTGADGAGDIQARGGVGGAHADPTVGAHHEVVAQWKEKALDRGKLGYADKGSQCTVDQSIGRYYGRWREGLAARLAAFSRGVKRQAEGLETASKVQVKPHAIRLLKSKVQLAITIHLNPGVTRNRGARIETTRFGDVLENSPTVVQEVCRTRVSRKEQVGQAIPVDVAPLGSLDPS